MLHLTSMFFSVFKCISKTLKRIIRFIPKGTVNNILGLDRLAGPKAPDPNY